MAELTVLFFNIKLGHEMLTAGTETILERTLTSMRRFHQKEIAYTDALVKRKNNVGRLAISFMNRWNLSAWTGMPF